MGWTRMGAWLDHRNPKGGSRELSLPRGEPELIEGGSTQRAGASPELAPHRGLYGVMEMSISIREQGPIRVLCCQALSSSRAGSLGQSPASVRRASAFLLSAQGRWNFHGSPLDEDSSKGPQIKPGKRRLVVT